MFLTNPDAVQSAPKKKKRNLSFEYKEDVARELIHLGVPLRVAETAVIDLRTDVTGGFHAKCSPADTARNLLLKVQQVYAGTLAKYSTKKPL